MIRLLIGLISLFGSVSILAFGLSETGFILDTWQGRNDLKSLALGGVSLIIGFGAAVASFIVLGS